MMNMLVYYIDRLTAPRVFGTKRGKEKKKKPEETPKEAAGK